MAQLVEYLPEEYPELKQSTTKKEKIYKKRKKCLLGSQF
jgi:hypothetical protein